MPKSLVRHEMTSPTIADPPDDRTVRDVGEFGLIDLLHAALPESVAASPSLLLGIGDDAAVWQPPDTAPLVVTTDSLFEGIHFRLDPGWSDWASLGHKSLAVNLSDLAAMGADPVLATVTLGLRGTERVGEVLAGYRAMGTLAEQTGTLIAGGDISRSPTAVAVSVTAIGRIPEGEPLTRHGARPGDIVAVSGTLGASAAGLRLLMLPEADPRRRATTAEILIAAHLRPTPRLALGRVLREQGATAAMDLSDGLFGDLPKILEASGVSAEIELAALPVAAAVRALFPDEFVRMATEGGEDYELLFTAPPERFDEIREVARAAGMTVTAIGQMTRAAERPQLFVRHPDGSMTVAERGAYDHFG